MFNWINFLTYALITAATPGPNNLMSMSNAGRLGFRRALPFNFGILAGFSVISFLCTLFCTVLAAFIPKIMGPMLVVGSLYMLYLAYKTYKSTGTIEESHGSSGFLSGMLLQFVNPKIFIYCIISMEAYILPLYSGQIPVLAAFSILLAFIGFLCTLCWSFFGSAFRLLFSKYARITNTVMALLLVYCAVSLFF